MKLIITYNFNPTIIVGFFIASNRFTFVRSLQAHLGIVQKYYTRIKI